MGLFDLNNPFVLKHTRDSVGYKYFETLRTNIRHEIASGNLPFVDGSDWLDELDGDRYVDIAHYSPNANRLIANKLEQLVRTCQSSQHNGGNRRDDVSKKRNMLIRCHRR